MAFASDTFAGTAGTELSAYSGVWSKQTGYTQNGNIGNDGQYAYHNGTTDYAVYQNSGSPASADYSVFADFFRKAGTPSGTGPQIGLIGRASAAAATFYCVLYIHGSTVYRLYRFNAGTPTQLGSDYTNTLTTTPKRIELRMSGSDISVYVDTVLRIGPVTDGSPITAAGKAGLMLKDMRQTGVNDTGGLDNWEAVDAGGGGGSSIVPIASNSYRLRRAA